jgi:hypothetical protein
VDAGVADWSVPEGAGAGAGAGTGADAGAGADAFDFSPDASCAVRAASAERASPSCDPASAVEGAARPARWARTDPASSSVESGIGRRIDFDDMLVLLAAGGPETGRRFIGTSGLPESNIPRRRAFGFA